MPPGTTVLEIDPGWRRWDEQMGSKPKFWFQLGNNKDERWLFKQARSNTGEHWAEKIASEIADLLKLPTHQVRIARFEGRIGCAVRSFMKRNEVLVHGNELLAGTVEGYDKDKWRGQADHNFDNIVHAIEELFPEDKVREILSVHLVGYFVFDALVGNTDRHHENWGLVLRTVTRRHEGMESKPQVRFQGKLAPTFDHGSSLGRELLEGRARELLADPKAIGRYIRKARGGIFADAYASHGLSPIALVELIAARYPRLVGPWKKRIAALPPDFAGKLLAEIPQECMSDASRDFTLAFLAESRKMITAIP